MASREEIESRVIDIICDHLGKPREKVTPAAHFINDLEADSLDIVELVMEFEDTFELAIPDEEQQKIQTVGDAIKYIAANT